jgi:hypothetical protein
VPFVERLGQRQRGLGGKAEAAVGFALQGGEVEQQRRQLCRWLALFFDRAMLAEAFLAEALGALDFPQAFGLGVLIFGFAEFFVEPAAAVAAGDSGEFGFHLPVIARPEGADAFLALDQDGQRRRLHAADRRLVESRPSFELKAVMARVPLMPISQSASERQRAASASGRISLSVRKWAKPSRMAPCVIDCSHRRRTGLSLLGVLSQVAEDQFALATRVAGIDEAGHVLALHQPSQQLEAILGLLDRIQRKCGGMTGRWAKDHLPRLTSYSSGTVSSSRWPMADDST